MSGAVALAVCIARTLHQRDGKVLQALRTELGAMQQELQPGTEAARMLYEFALALGDEGVFPKA